MAPRTLEQIAVAIVTLELDDRNPMDSRKLKRLRRRAHDMIFDECVDNGCRGMTARLEWFHELLGTIRARMEALDPRDALCPRCRGEREIRGSRSGLWKTCRTCEGRGTVNAPTNGGQS